MPSPVTPSDGAHAAGSGPGSRNRGPIIFDKNKTSGIPHADSAAH